MRQLVGTAGLNPLRQRVFIRDSLLLCAKNAVVVDHLPDPKHLRRLLTGTSIRLNCLIVSSITCSTSSVLVTSAWVATAVTPCWRSAAAAFSKSSFPLAQMETRAPSFGKLPGDRSAHAFTGAGGEGDFSLQLEIHNCSSL
jgi:hypothetical protein